MAADKVPQEIMVRALDMKCAEKISALARKQGTTKNQIVRRLLNEVTKNDQLIEELFAGDGAESQLRRFTNLMPALAWGDNAFQKHQSLEVLDFYSAILAERAYQVFPGLLQIARYRCGFASLDVGLDYETRGIIESNVKVMSLADRFIALGTCFFRQYGSHCESTNKAWHEGMSHYNLACSFAQRSRLNIYKEMCSSVHGFVIENSLAEGTSVDHAKLWSAPSPVLDWRDVISENTRKLVDNCKDEAFRELRRMSFTQASHLPSWIAEAEFDPDLLALRNDLTFGKEFSTWISNAKKDLDVAGNIFASSNKLIDSIEARQPELATLLKAEESRGK